MSRKIFVLFALTTGLFISAHASENVNTPENRQFLKQQETLSQQLRENGQLRIGFGSAKHPDCRGITVDELQKIQFDSPEFSEAELRPVHDEYDPQP